jgi:hypothetical protein
VADDAVMDFSATESFTLLVVRREWGTTVINNSIVAAKIGVSGPYYALTIDTATQKLSASIYDGTIAAAALSASAPTDGTMLLHGLVRDVGNDLVRVYQGGTEVGNSPDTTTGTLVNSGPFYVGYNSGTAFWDGETIMAALWRRILTPTEIAAIATFYGV